VLAAAAYKRVIMRAPADVGFAGMPGRLEFVSEIASGYLLLEKGTALPLVVSLETDAGPVTDMECLLTAEIVFGPAEVLEGEPVLKILGELAHLVDSIADGFLAAGLLS
jgi:hypothetical protein